MRNILGIASTPYHLMMLLFIRENLSLNGENPRFDLLLTDKTPSFDDLYKSGRPKECFDQVYFADSRLIKNPYSGALTQLYESFIHNPEYGRMFTSDTPDPGIYSDIFFASPGMPDEVSKQVIKSAIKANRQVCFHRYEDGFASYTKPPVCSVTSDMGRRFYRLLMRYDIKEKENELYMLEPSLAQPEVADTAATGFKLCTITKNEEIIKIVTEKIKILFDHRPERIPADYIFLGQSTKNVINNPDTYLSLIKHIVEKTGYDRFCMKPHPRGVHDRFDDSLTYYEDPAPFEICYTDGQMETKTLISYYSTACVSGKLLFNSKCRIIFLYPLAGDSFNEKSDYEEYFEKLQKLYDNI
ncbi:MAG: hypothetical protein J5842_06160, partial [Lachnospiraceae bacterium]|nr:hypothetical protein [Lachnospiraceae bacterium]